MRTKVVLIALVAGLILVAAAQPANAAWVRYANAKATAYGKMHQTGLLPRVTGGKVTANISQPSIYLHIKTVTMPPGATEISSVGTAPGWLYLSHNVKKNYYSRCLWTFQHDIGKPKLTCEYSK